MRIGGHGREVTDTPGGVGSAREPLTDHPQPAGREPARCRGVVDRETREGLAVVKVVAELGGERIAPVIPAGVDAHRLEHDGAEADKFGGVHDGRAAHRSGDKSSSTGPCRTLGLLLVGHRTLLSPVRKML